MAEQVGGAEAVAWLIELARVCAEKKDELTDLDAAIGDADHGLNLDRGLSAVKEQLTDQPASPADVFKQTAMTLIKTVGGASGPLYGTFFLRAGQAIGDRESLSPADVAEMFRAGLVGVIQRGQAQVGDKTMIDALSPAIETMDRAKDKTLGQMMAEAAAAAEGGMKATIPLQARKGRASYLGERSIGHQDPGATSSFLMIRAAARAWSD